MRSCNPLAPAIQLHLQQRCKNVAEPARTTSDRHIVHYRTLIAADEPRPEGPTCPTERPGSAPPPPGTPLPGGAPRPPRSNYYSPRLPSPHPKTEKNHHQNRARPKTDQNNPAQLKTNHDPLQVVCTHEPHHNSTGVFGVFGVFWPSYTRVTPSMPSFKAPAVSPKHPGDPEHPGFGVPTPRSRPLLAWRQGAAATASSLQNEDEPDP